MKDFSIILPSRDRQGLLMNLIQSISSTAKDLDKVEVLVAFDQCDPKMQDFAAKNSFSFVTFHAVPRSLNFSRDYYSFLSRKSTGRWVIACNDDAEFQTPGWDLLSRSVLEQYNHNRPNIVYGWIEDHLSSHRLTQFGNYCCFPLLGRDGIDALGYYFPASVPTWGADIWVEKLYRNIGRCAQLPMTIKHISHHNGLRAQDDINKRIASNQVNADINPSYAEINKLLGAIRAKAVV